MAKNSTTWAEALPVVMLGLRATLKPDINATPAQLVFGTTPRLPGDLITDQLDTAHSCGASVHIITINLSNLIQ